MDRTQLDANPLRWSKADPTLPTALRYTMSRHEAVRAIQESVRMTAENDPALLAIKLIPKGHLEWLRDDARVAFDPVVPHLEITDAAVSLVTRDRRTEATLHETIAYVPQLAEQFGIYADEVAASFPTQDEIREAMTAGGDRHLPKPPSARRGRPR